MHLESYVAQYTFTDILAIEQSDRQFIALQEAWRQVSILGMPQDLFVYLVVQCALISFQVAGSGSDRWEEFAMKIVVDYSVLIDLDTKNTDWWYDFLTHSRYNKRLYNIKRKRLEKFGAMYNTLIAHKKLVDWYESMAWLCQKLAAIMQQSPDSKTITFSVKMFGYAARIVTGAFVQYPMTVRIPVDSRLIKVYEFSEGGKISEKNIQEFYQKMAEKYQIPPLHLDSLIWIEYWKLI